jgi:hypothetical protein
MGRLASHHPTDLRLKYYATPCAMQSRIEEGRDGEREGMQARSSASSSSATYNCSGPHFLSIFRLPGTPDASMRFALDCLSRLRRKRPSVGPPVFSYGDEAVGSAARRYQSRIFSSYE